MQVSLRDTKRTHWLSRDSDFPPHLLLILPLPQGHLESALGFTGCCHWPEGGARLVLMGELRP